MRVVPGNLPGSPSWGQWPEAPSLVLAWLQSSYKCGHHLSPPELYILEGSFPVGILLFLDIVLGTQWGSKAILDTDSSKQLLLDSV